VNEPELAAGDSGEWVVQLQTRLHELNRYAGSLDGEFGEPTEAAVAQLQQDNGLRADGKVGALTWAALVEAESAAGLREHVPADGRPVTGALSDDEQWRWDGQGWQPAETTVGAAVATGEHPAAGHVSANGQWMWDGSGWKPLNS
jgi:hypothetical protein